MSAFCTEGTSFAFPETSKGADFASWASHSGHWVLDCSADILTDIKSFSCAPFTHGVTQVWVLLQGRLHQFEQSNRMTENSGSTSLLRTVQHCHHSGDNWKHRRHSHFRSPGAHFGQAVRIRSFLLLTAFRLKSSTRLTWLGSLGAPLASLDYWQHIWHWRMDGIGGIGDSNIPNIQGIEGPSAGTLSCSMMVQKPARKGGQGKNTRDKGPVLCFAAVD